MHLGLGPAWPIAWHGTMFNRGERKAGRVVRIASHVLTLTQTARGFRVSVIFLSLCGGRGGFFAFIRAEVMLRAGRLVGWFAHRGHAAAGAFLVLY